MEEATVMLEVPVALYERAERLAREKNGSAESLLLDTLSNALGDLTAMELEPEDLQALEDDQLYGVAHQRLAQPQEDRLRELLNLAQSGMATDAEIAELEALGDLVEHQMLLRSEALLLLKQRGRDIDSLLMLGA